MHTDTESDVATQHRAAETKREKQYEVVHHPRNDLIGIDQSNLMNCQLREMKRVNVVPIRWPTNSWKPLREPYKMWMMGDIRCKIYKGKGHNNNKKLQ
jgi:hypothetical protein